MSPGKTREAVMTRAHSARSTFTLYVHTLTESAREILDSPSLLALFEELGVPKKDFEGIRDAGERAELYDRLQRSTRASLGAAQRRFSGKLAQVIGAVKEIQGKKLRVIDTLRDDPAATEEEISFVQNLSFAIPAVPRRPFVPENYKRDSAAQEAKRLELTRLIGEIEERPRIAALYAERKVNVA